MRIVDIKAMRLKMPPRQLKTKPRRQSWHETAEVANPMSGYPRLKAHRSLWLPNNWEPVWCKVTLEDGTWGLGQTDLGRAAAAVIDDHIAPNLIGEDGLAIEKLADMMWRMSKVYGSSGIASYAISAVDLALWDAKGHLLGQLSTALLAARRRINYIVTVPEMMWIGIRN